MNTAKTHLTRRSAMKLGLAAGTCLSLDLHAAEVDALPLITKEIPGSAKKIPVIGLGTNQYGVTTEEELAPRREALRQFPKLGLTLIDTAPGYGKSEEVLGNLITELGIRDQLFIATKVTVDGDDVKKGVEMLEESFKRLQTKHIELVQVHSLRGWEALLPLLRDWKKEGRISFYGVTTSDDKQYPDLIKILEKEALDFVQFDYSVGNRNAEEKILPLVAEKKIASLVNMPLGGRRGANLISSTTGKPLPDFAKEINASSWAQILLKYVVSHPAVTAAIPGTTKLKHLEDNAAAARGVLPDARLRKRIEEAFAAL
ncbi:aldo/keto reductase [Luteolibacter sp. Populi]|uniref:aldo/keto reductase n=1 Tax=Luteolibacter sp. Populi TaxID=3230487 RepID=UPI00346559F2